MLSNLVSAGCFGNSLADKKDKEYAKADAFCNKQTKEKCNDASVRKKYRTYYCEIDERGVCRPLSMKDN
uniref:Lipoprotein n=1 Tax=Globodera rostochiensis TaxID=31243 RepID=A0A914IDJ6_GLORO